MNINMYDKWFFVALVLAVSARHFVKYMNRLAFQTPEYSEVWKAIGVFGADWEALEEMLDPKSPKYRFYKYQAAIPYSDGSTPLLMACRYGNEVPPAVMRNLLLANPDAVRTPGGLFGQMPLHLAAERGVNEQSFALLLQASPTIADVKDKTGKRPLDWAQQNRHSRIVEMLKTK